VKSGANWAQNGLLTKVKDGATSRTATLGRSLGEKAKAMVLKKGAGIVPAPH
jgi:hypothetical protein